MEERLGIVGSGVIACGLAATAAAHGEVVLWARSMDSAERARTSVSTIFAALSDEEEAEPETVEVVTDLEALAEATFVVEAVVEHHGSKASVLAELAKHAGEDAVLATTTSSLSIKELSEASGHPERFVGVHVFNPVPRMKLVELVFPEPATESTRARARDLCEALDKIPVEVPDVPGFVVNRLLFPYLFAAVRLLEETGVEPKVVDQCMTLGAGVPMGPIALLDFVGLDVAQAIGEAIGTPVPAKLRELVTEGALGRKTKRGFYNYG